MVFYRARRTLIKSIIDTLNYWKVLYRSAAINEKKKSIHVDISEIALNRYLYNFLKFFHIKGYTVYLPKSKKIISLLSRDKGEFKYASWLLKEGIVKFVTAHKFKGDIILNKHQLSNDYFSCFFYNEFKENTYHVPMSEFPGIYHYNDWTEDFQIEKRRKRSLFMIGNIHKDYYDNIAKDKLFDIPSRRAIANFIYLQPYYHGVKSRIDIENFIKSELDNKVLLIDTSEAFQIEGGHLKTILKKFDFYLALPGIIIPQSHNIVEALSVGCIPILHQTYASLFRPGLQHNYNCLVYSTLEGLDVLIKEIPLFSGAEILSLRKNVSSYYNQYLSPNAVVKEIEQNTFSKIYLQAEEISLHLLKKL